jgi:hypothetical protein
VISGFCHKVDEMCTPLGYAVYSGNSLPTFWDSVSVPSSRVMNPRRPVTQVGSMPQSSTEWLHSPPFQFHLFIYFCFCPVFIVAFYFIYMFPLSPHHALGSGLTFLGCPASEWHQATTPTTPLLAYINLSGWHHGWEPSTTHTFPYINCIPGLQAFLLTFECGAGKWFWNIGKELPLHTV